jgi:hypothetical protein
VIQAKLKVNEPGDIYEQEADRVADQMMAVPAHPAIKGAPPRIQRLSRQSNGLDTAPASVDQTLARPGRPLEPALQQDMEQRFGHDFSMVRIHSGAAAQQSAEDVNASAYTVGHNVVFGADQFAPGTDQGRRLLAHELTHVVQQSGSGRSYVDSSNEKRGLAVPGTIVSGLIQRQPVDAPPKPPLPAKHVRSLEERLNPAALSDGVPLPSAITEFVPRILGAINGARYKSVKGSGYAHGATKEEALWQGSVAFARLFAKDVIYNFNGTGKLLEVETNLSQPVDPAKPYDFPPPKFPLPPEGEGLVLVVESSTKRKWQAFRQNSGRLEMLPFAGSISVPDEMARGQLAVFIYAPGHSAAEDGGPQPGWKAEDEKAKPAQPPGWATSQYERVKRVLQIGSAAKAGAAEPPGTGTGRKGEGPGGGGIDVLGVGTGKAGTGTGAATAERGPGRGGDKKKPPDPKKPDKIVLWMGKSGPMLNVWKGRSAEAIALKPSETEESLKGRIEAASARQQSTGERIVDSGTGTQIGGEGGAKASAEEIAEATKFTANAAAYPSRIDIQAGSGAEVSPAGWATTITGARHNFDMILDWDARHFGLANQTFARLGWVHYYWQVIDVGKLDYGAGGKTQGDFEQGADFQKRMRSTVAGSSNMQAWRLLKMAGLPTEGVSGVREAKAFEGFKAKVSAKAEQKVAESEEDKPEFSGYRPWEWGYKASELAVIGLDMGWNIGKALIGAWVDKMTEPENRREIKFGDTGDYVVRCLANPQADESKPYDKQTRRATSIAVFPVRVVDVNSRAREVTREDKAQLDQAKALLDATKKELDKNPDDLALQKAFQMAQYQVGLQEASYNWGTVEKLGHELEDYDKQITVLEYLSDPKHSIDNVTGPLHDVALELKRDISLRFKRGPNGFVAWYDYQYHLHDVKEARKKKAEQKETAQKKSESIAGDSQLRPRVTFVSEENGAIVRMDMILGREKGSKPTKPSWVLADVTSPDTARSYDGSSEKPGAEGDAEAVTKAFEAFAEKAEYGHGTISIEIPGRHDLIHEGRTMLMKPGRVDRWKGRLRSLIEIAGIVAPYVKGGALLGRLAAIGGALDAGTRLYDRATNDQLKANFETLADVVALIGPLGHGIGSLAETNAVRQTTSGFVMRTFAKTAEVANEFIMPASFLHDLDKLVTDPNLKGPERDAAIAMLFGRGLRDGIVQYVKVTGRGRAGGEPPAASGTGHEPALPSGGAAGERVTPGKPGVAGVERQPAPDISHKFDTSDVQPIEPAARKVTPGAEKPKPAASESTTGAAKPEGAAQPRPAESSAPRQRPDNRPATEHNVEIIRRETTPDPSARARATEYVPMFTNWKRLGASRRKARVEGLINGYLAREGIPPVAIEWGAKPEGHAQFDPASWTMTLSKDVIERDEISADSFATLVDNAVHETQHTVTTYRGIRVALATERFNPEVAIPGKIVGEAIAANKRKHPDREFDEATRGEALEIYQKQIEPTPIGPVERGEVSREGVLARLDAASKSLRNAERLRREAAKELAQRPNDPDLQQHAAETEAAYQDAVREEREAHNDYVGMVEETASWRRGTGARVAVAEQIALQLRRDDARREADEALKAEKKARRLGDPIGARVAARKRREAKAVERQAQADIDVLGARAETQLVGGNVVKRAVPLTEREIAAAPKAPKKGYVEKGEALRRAGAPEPKPTQAEKPPASKGSVPKKTPATPPPLTVISRYGSRAKFVEAVTKKLGTDIHPRPPGWERVIEALKANPGKNNIKILARIEKVMDALQNPKLYAKVLGDAWDLVKAGEATDINEALKQMAEKTGLAVNEIPETKQYRPDEFFAQVATQKAYWVDKPLGQFPHGAMTHLLQDLVVNEALGGPDKSAEFRELLGKAEGTVERYVRRGGQLVPSKFAELPNTIFVDEVNQAGDVVPEVKMQTGDYVWRFMYDLLYQGDALKDLGRLPQPEVLRPLLNLLRDFYLR